MVKSGQYTSYWNAVLFLLLKQKDGDVFYFTNA